MTLLDIILAISSLLVFFITIINCVKYEDLEDYIIGRGYFNFLLFIFKIIFLSITIAYFSSKIDFNFLTTKIF